MSRALLCFLGGVSVGLHLCAPSVGSLGCQRLWCTAKAVGKVNVHVIRLANVFISQVLTSIVNGADLPCALNPRLSASLILLICIFIGATVSLGSLLGGVALEKLL